MCDCRERVNKSLEDKNACIAIGFMAGTEDGSTRYFLRSAPMIVLEKKLVTLRTKLPTLLASYCPFCGEKYPQ